MTARELSEATGLKLKAIANRLTEWYDEGLLHVAGRAARRPGDILRAVNVYRIGPEKAL